MDVTGSFFNKLRTLAATLEKQAEQLKQVFQGDGTGKRAIYNLLVLCDKVMFVSMNVS